MVGSSRCEKNVIYGFSTGYVGHCAFTAGHNEKVRFHWGGCDSDAMRAIAFAGNRTAWLVVRPRRGLHIEQRTYDISTGTGSLELSVILFSPEIFTSNATSETVTPSEHDAITRTFDPSSCNDLTVHF